MATKEMPIKFNHFHFRLDRCIHNSKKCKKINEIISVSGIGTLDVYLYVICQAMSTLDWLLREVRGQASVCPCSSWPGWVHQCMVREHKQFTPEGCLCPIKVTLEFNPSLDGSWENWNSKFELFKCLLTGKQQCTFICLKIWFISRSLRKQNEPISGSLLHRGTGWYHCALCCVVLSLVIFSMCSCSLLLKRLRPERAPALC